MLFFIVGAAALFAVDIVTKILFEGKAFSLIKGLFSIASTHNDGAAFSFFSGGRIVLIIITILILTGGLIFYTRFDKRNDKLFNVAYAFIIGGALGNLVDRIFLGYVRDFIKLDFMSFPIFNFADIWLNLGMILLAVYFLFFYKTEKENNQNKENKNK